MNTVWVVLKYEYVPKTDYVNGRDIGNWAGSVDTKCGFFTSESDAIAAVEQRREPSIARWEADMRKVRRNERLRQQVVDDNKKLKMLANKYDMKYEPLSVPEDLLYEGREVTYAQWIHVNAETYYDHAPMYKGVM